MYVAGRKEATHKAGHDDSVISSIDENVSEIPALAGVTLERECTRTHEVNSPGMTSCKCQASTCPRNGPLTLFLKACHVAIPSAPPVT